MATQENNDEVEETLNFNDSINTRTDHNNHHYFIMRAALMIIGNVNEEENVDRGRGLYCFLRILNIVSQHRYRT